MRTLGRGRTVPVGEDTDFADVAAVLEDAAGDVAGEVGGGFGGAALRHDNQFVKGHGKLYQQIISTKKHR